ncbi:MAG TPA: amidase family protein [Microvirga sp.]|jgi:amidase|nr:amidase family protein [Microvirga sp.]
MTLLNASATALRARLLAREMSAVELLDATFRQVDAANPAVNAVVGEDRDAARKAAEDSDRRIAAGTARPLEGLPITVKDSFDVAGLLSTAGAPMYKARIPAADAAPVARLRHAGAVIFGKSLVPVFTGDFQAFNPLHGIARNPYDPERSPGGSSGGAAAAVAAGMSAFEIASDLGGSVRWPAHACGVFGLKTTWNLVPTWGHVPPMPERRPPRNVDLMVAGPIARSAADLDLVLSVLAGPRDDPAAVTPLKPPRRIAPEGLRVALWLDEPFAPVQADVSAAVRRAAGLLREAGASIDELARPAFRFEEAFEVFSLLNHAIVAYSLPPKVRDRLQRAAGTFAPGDLSHRALQARGARMTPGLYQQVKARKQRLESLWARFFERFDVVLCPPAPVVAIPHDHSPDFHGRILDIDGTPKPYFDFMVWSSLATAADLPAAVAPVMRNAHGLPAGVQIIAAKAEDRTAIAVAAMLEALGCRYEAPPL